MVKEQKGPLLCFPFILRETDLDFLSNLAYYNRLKCFYSVKLKESFAIQKKNNNNCKGIWMGVDVVDKKIEKRPLCSGETVRLNKQRKYQKGLYIATYFFNEIKTYLIKIERKSAKEGCKEKNLVTMVKSKKELPHTPTISILISKISKQMNKKKSDHQN